MFRGIEKCRRSNFIPVFGPYIFDLLKIWGCSGDTKITFFKPARKSQHTCFGFLKKYGEKNGQSDVIFRFMKGGHLSKIGHFWPFSYFWKRSDRIRPKCLFFKKLTTYGVPNVSHVNGYLVCVFLSHNII